MFIIKLSPEITIKSKPVRKRGILLLKNNIKKHLNFENIDCEISGNWDRIIVKPYLEQEKEKIKDIFKRISGLAYFLETDEFNLANSGDIFTDILAKVKEYYVNRIEGKTFVVRVKRSGNHDFKSLDLERYLGGELLQIAKNAKVKLENPEITIFLEIKDDNFYIVKDRIEGIGGYPVGFQDRVLSLISGGFDSSVSTYELIKRGCLVDFLFFNLGGNAHEIGVKQVAYYLWKNYEIAHNKARFITINFEDIIKLLMEKINHKYRGILLKRYMLKVASMIAENNYYALIKGDSLGQVSSQTLKNMFVIDKASTTLVLRPLISKNKQEIIDISKLIGTHDFASNMPEYCGIISDKPSTGASLDKIILEEEKIDEEIILKTFLERKVEFVKDILFDIDLKNDLFIVNKLDYNDMVIDIREVEKIKKSPLFLERNQILEIPFYEINSKFKNLDQSKNYFFYCDKGVLSNLHALYLKDKGFKNIGLYRIIK